MLRFRWINFKRLLNVAPTVKHLS